MGEEIAAVLAQNLDKILPMIEISVGVFSLYFAISKIVLGISKHTNDNIKNAVTEVSNTLGNKIDLMQNDLCHEIEGVQKDVTELKADFKDHVQESKAAMLEYAKSKTDIEVLYQQNRDLQKTVDVQRTSIDALEHR